MKAATGTEFVRDDKQIAAAAPKLKSQSALELFGDIYRPLEGPVDDDWMADVRKMDKLFHSTLDANLGDPWEE